MELDVSKVLKVVLEGSHELICQSAVNQPVVVGEAHIDHAPNSNRIILHDHRTLLDAADAQNGDLGLINDGNSVQATVLARIRDCEGAALNLLREELLASRSLSKVGDLLLETSNIEILSKPHGL